MAWRSWRATIEHELLQYMGCSKGESRLHLLTPQSSYRCMASAELHAELDPASCAINDVNGSQGSVGTSFSNLKCWQPVRLQRAKPCGPEYRVSASQLCVVLKTVSRKSEIRLHFENLLQLLLTGITDVAKLLGRKKLADADADAVEPHFGTENPDKGDFGTQLTSSYNLYFSFHMTVSMSAVPCCFRFVNRSHGRMRGSASC